MTTTITHWINAQPASTNAVLAASAVITLGILWRITAAATRKIRTLDAADVITVIVALAATTYAGVGTWHYLVKAMHAGPDLRIVLVTVLEGAVIVSGLRARKNIAKSDTGSAGADGIALWALTALSAMLSASEAASVREACGRLAVPLVAAWLWERLLAPERRARKEQRPVSLVRWRITRERIAVFLRLADATDTDVSAPDAARRVVRYLKATDRASRRIRNPLSAAARADRARTRLFGHALMHFADPAAVHSALATRMLDDALDRLGITPGCASDTASGAHPETDNTAGHDRTRRAPKTRTTPRSRRAAKRLTDAQLMPAVERLNTASLADDGRPVSLRKLQTELHIGQARATALLDALTAASEAAPEPPAPKPITLILGKPYRRGMFAANGTPQH